MNNYNRPLSAPRKRYYPNLWVISFLIKDEIAKRDLKARKENSPVDCFGRRVDESMIVNKPQQARQRV